MVSDCTCALRSVMRCTCTGVSCEWVSSRSTLVSARGQHVSSYDKFRHRAWLDVLRNHSRCGRNEHTSTRITEIESATLTHIAMTARQRALPANHRISRTHDAVFGRMAITVHVIKLELRQPIIHVDDKEEQFTLGNHLFQLEGTCGRISQRRSSACRSLQAHCKRITAVAAAAAVVAIVFDVCSTVCLSTAVMTMQQSPRLIGGGSPGSQDSRRPRHPSCL